jgi:outer membrane immunogenic protein
MKKLTTAIAAIALIGTSAFAADMAVKAPPPAPAPVYNWTGWYVGVNAGASFGNVKTDFNAPAAITANAGSGPGSLPADLAGSDRTYPSGFIGGGQIGYNWQLSPIWVVGLEADFQGAIEKDSNTLTGNFTGGIALPGGGSIPFASVSTVLDYHTKIEWFGTARLRAGYVWGNGNVFSYVTGGLAYGKVDLEGTNSVTSFCCAIGAPVTFSFSPSQAFGHSQVNTGWVVGYGTEGKLLIPGWTLKAEYLYVDLGHLDATGPGGSSTFTSGPVTIVETGGQVSTHSHFTDNIVRVGLNYQFH